MSHRLTPVSRRLRRDATSAERVLWRALRGGQVDGFKFRRQAPIAGFIADFACHEAKLIIEIDGATHSSDEELAHDARRQVILETAGYTVLRFYNEAVYKHLDSVVDAVLLKLNELRPRVDADEGFSTPHPNPPPTPKSAVADFGDNEHIGNSRCARERGR